MSTPPYLHPKNSGARRQPRLLHPGLKINSERLSGSQSVVHFVVEVATGKEMICKIIKNADLKSFTNELKALQAINDCGLWEHGFPRILSTMQDEEQFEILIEAQGKNLRQVLDELKQENYTKSTIMKIGIQALDLLELIHDCHFVHGDLKLENMVYGSKDKNKIFLIDFGLATKILTDCGQHIERVNLKTFSGNFLFASMNSCRGYTKSRRDDVESLIYIITYYLSNKYLPWCDLMRYHGCTDLKSLL